MMMVAGLKSSASGTMFDLLGVFDGEVAARDDRHAQGGKVVGTYGIHVRPRP